MAQAARFIAVGLQRGIPFDFVALLGDASGLSFAGLDLGGAVLEGLTLTGCDFSKVTGIAGCRFDDS